jgi:hypothetical protein
MRSQAGGIAFIRGRELRMTRHRWAFLRTKPRMQLKTVPSAVIRGLVRSDAKIDPMGDPGNRIRRHLNRAESPSFAAVCAKTQDRGACSGPSGP